MEGLIFGILRYVSKNCLKVSEKSGKNQGIFNFLMSGNPDHCSKARVLHFFQVYSQYGTFLQV